MKICIRSKIGLGMLNFSTTSAQKFSYRTIAVEKVKSFFPRTELIGKQTFQFQIIIMLSTAQIFGYYFDKELAVFDYNFLRRTGFSLNLFIEMRRKK